MTRHGKNCTAGTVYTYHERKKDTQKSGYGSKAVRLGKDSVKNFDCCSLTLQPCREPVVTLDGFLYDREAILECLLHQKTEAARKMKAFEKQKKKQEAEEAGKVEEQERSKVESFESMEKRITTKPTSAFTVTKNKNVAGPSVVMDEQQPSTSSGKYHRKQDTCLFRKCMFQKCSQYYIMSVLFLLTLDLLNLRQGQKSARLTQVTDRFINNTYSGM